ncbi:hypothetical protein [Undibacterium sp. Xuan67W]|uniref:hypothetical protein n=1 Tax=Undibacterium sp. Xuan67W TaxID=3413057 RepID=UPI003BF1F1CA
MRHWKIVVAALAVALAVNVSFAGAVKAGAPAGWQLWGPEGDQYEIGIDTAEGSADHPVLLIASKTQPTDEALAITQDIDATEWQGKLIEFKMMVRAVGAEKNKIWIRHMGMSRYLQVTDKTIPDGKGWQEMTLTSYFPGKVESHYDNHFEIGIGLGSPGKIWIKDIKLSAKPVPPPDPKKTLDMPSFRSGIPAYGPRNLSFTE